MSAAVVRCDKLILKGSPLSGLAAVNPQPFFLQPDLAVKGGPGFPQDKYYGFGRETGFRVLPYTMQDRYGRELIDIEIPSVVMENDFLRAVFIPALGGRLWSLFDKRRNRDILYRNPVFRPANLAIRDAWFSGGVEWNIGRLGHAVHTCTPVFAGTFEMGGQSVLRFWEFERQSRLFWRMDFTLPEDSAVLFSYARVENPDSNTKPLYWWANTAIPQTSGTRIFSASSEVIFIVPDTGKVKTMGYGRLPDLPVLPGKDASYPSLSDYSNEYFFQNDRVPEKKSDTLPWESAVYEDGYAYGEVSTKSLLYRKVFCWGSGKGGRRWQDFLSLPGQEYLEVQAGLAPTQLHTVDIAGGQAVDWVQAFTAFQVEPDLAHQRDYEAARAYVEDCLLTGQICPVTVQTALEQGRERFNKEAEILSMGSGWGALECKRTSPGLLFPENSIGKEEAPWAELLRTGVLPLRSVEAGPGSFVIDKSWETLLAASPLREGDWLTPYHLGVIAYEKGVVEKAAAYWKESLKQAENPWAYRNLALIAVNSGNTQQALDFYSRSFRLPGGQDQSFMEEYIPLLLAAGNEDDAEAELDAYIHRTGSVEDLSNPLLEAAARIALNRGNDALLDRIFSLEPVHIREGNTTLVTIWNEREIRRLTETGMSQADAEQQVQKSQPPATIDFRMYNRS
jgi:tetratricopeptide (TPR) repeat protein